MTKRLDWQPGQWVECPRTQEKGQVLSSHGPSIEIALGNGITLYGSSQALQNLGWQPLQTGIHHFDPPEPEE